MIKHPNRRYAQKYALNRITKGPGCYGIFVKNNKSKLGIGKCLYIGQSVNVPRRIAEHKENIQKARNKDQTVPKMYQKIAEDYTDDVIKFVKVYSVDKATWTKMDKDQALTYLSILEQYFMDSYSPILNYAGARKSIF